MTIFDVQGISDGEKFKSHVLLFCKCGWSIELFNGHMGFCRNVQCEEFNRLYEVMVSLSLVSPQTDKQRTQ